MRLNNPKGNRIGPKPLTCRRFCCFYSVRFVFALSVCSGLTEASRHHQDAPVGQPRFGEEATSSAVSGSSDDKGQLHFHKIQHGDSGSHTSLNRKHSPKIADIRLHLFSSKSRSADIVRPEIDRSTGPDGWTFSDPPWRLKNGRLNKVVKRLHFETNVLNPAVVNKGPAHNKYKAHSGRYGKQRLRVLSSNILDAQPCFFLLEIDKIWREMGEDLFNGVQKDVDISTRGGHTIRLSRCRAINTSVHDELLLVRNILQVLLESGSNDDPERTLKGLIEGIQLQCQGITSCLKVVTGFQSSRKERSRRQLLSIDDVSLVKMDKASHSLLVIATLSSFLIVFAAVLCACKKKRTKKTDDPDVLLKQVTPRTDRRSTNLENTIVSINNDRASIHITNEEKRRSCGQVVNGPHQLGHSRNDSRSSGRGGTLDRRLPDIPMASPAPPPSHSEDELDDTYDVITPSVKQEPQNKTEYDSKTDNSDTKTDEGSLRYEPIKITEVYTEVGDVKLAEAEKQTSAPLPLKPMRGDETYEDVDKDEVRTRQEKRISNHCDKIRRESPYSRLDGDESVESSGDGVISCARPQSQMTNSLPRAQSEEVYETYDEVANDSGRDSNGYGEVGDAVFEEDGNYASVDHPPPVPLRQYSTDEVSGRSSGAQSPTSINRNSAVLPPIVGPGAPLPAPCDPNLSDPPYSQVTARESLASIRARQQQGLTHLSHDYYVVDNVYEPVDEQPETTKARTQSVPIPEPGDWYTEIDCSAGKTRDEDPIEDAPPQNPERNRSYSTGASPDDLYANVDKSKKTNRTHSASVYVSSTGDVEAPYARVDKSKKRKPREHNDDTTPTSPPEDFKDLEGGLRPKFRLLTELKEAESTPRDSVDSCDYQRVGDVAVTVLSQSDSGEHIEDEDPDYATVRCNENDCTYDVIGNDSAGANKAESENMFHMDNHKLPENFWVRQEPVYSEVDDDNCPSEVIIPVTVI